MSPNKPELYKASKLPPSPTALLPAEPESSQFFTLFPHWWDFIYADIPDYGTSPSWLTQTAYPLDARNAWNAYHEPNVLVGVRFDVTTRYILFDIDWGSRYHPRKSLSSYKRFIGTMEDAGFTRYMVVSSSESGGLHVYFFLPEAVSTAVLAEAVDQLLREKGFDISDGTLEVFPNVKSEADSRQKAHRLPLQRGSYVLDPMTFEPIHRDVSAFLREAVLDAAGQDSEAIREFIARAKVKRLRISKRSFSTEGGSFRADLLERMREGWTGYGQTNEILWVIGAYGRIFLRLEEKALISYIVHTSKASPGYRDYCRHQHEIERRARDWMRFSMKHYYPYGEWMERNTKYWRRDWRYTALGIGVFPARRTPQEETHEDTLTRVRYVVEQLKEEGELPRTVTGRVASIRKKLRELFGQGTSMDTLYKEEYRALWHPSCDERFPMLPDPWEEELEQSGVRSPNHDGEGRSTTASNRYIRALPPVREECTKPDCEEIFIKPAQRSEQPQTRNHHTTSSTPTTHNPSLSSNSGANPAPTDKPYLSVKPMRSHVLPGTWCRVIGYARGLPKGVRVLVDSRSQDGKTVRVRTRRGEFMSGIPPDCLEPDDSP